MKNINELMDKTDHHEVYDKVIELFEKLLSETDPKRRSDIILRMNKFLSDVEGDINEIKLPLDNYIQGLYHVKDYEVAFLQDYAVYIYYWFVEIIIFRTIFGWPNDNNEKQTFSGLYSVIFRMISETRLQLLELFRNNKLSIMAMSPIRSIAYIIRLFRDNNLKPHFLPQYYILGMDSEIKPVANSLLRLSEEIKDHNFIDMKHFEYVNDIDGIFKINEVYNTFLRWIEESKHMTEIQLNSPEYRHQSEMALQAVKKIMQLQSQK